MGLTLDESENTQDTIVNKNEVDILLDRDMKRFLEGSGPVKVDFHESKYGSGFFIETGYSC